MPVERAALEEQRDYLLGAIRRLDADHDAGLVDDADHVVLRDDYTARAAHVLRALEALDAAEAADRAPRAERPGGGPAALVADGDSPRWRPALIAGLVLAVLLGLTLAVSRSATERGPDQALTGLDPAADGPAGALSRAQQDFVAGRYVEALQGFEEVLAADPDNTAALTSRGWLLRLTSLQIQGEDQALLQARALASFDRALAADPTLVDARVFRAVLLADLGRDAEALAELDAVPSGALPPEVTPLVQQLRQRLEGGQGTTAPGTP